MASHAPEPPLACGASPSKTLEMSVGLVGLGLQCCPHREAHP